MLRLISSGDIMSKPQQDQPEAKSKSPTGEAPKTKEAPKIASVDPKVFYGYLFQPDKKPTKILSALLRGIAGYIVSAEKGDDEVICSSHPLILNFDECSILSSSHAIGLMLMLTYTGRECWRQR